jgi:hypothetical protein
VDRDAKCDNQPAPAGFFIGVTAVAKKLGNDYRLWIESATPGTYNMLKGQQDLSINRSSSPIDTSTKDDFPYGTSAPGLRSLSVPFTIIPDLPDANGYTRMETAALASTAAAVKFQIRKGGLRRLGLRHRLQHQRRSERQHQDDDDARHCRRSDDERAGLGR